MRRFLLGVGVGKIIQLINAALGGSFAEVTNNNTWYIKSLPDQLECMVQCVQCTAAVLGWNIRTTYIHI